ncbi:MAG: hypothetical protein HYY61_00560 [Deltaproteobacteria bacterium]|nr:hypothetical protein [Deltaproteobacteria bacterium]
MKLIDILDLLGPRAGTLKWEISDIESIGSTSGELYKLSTQGDRVSCPYFLRLAKNTIQVIDGEFRGYEDDREEPWIVIHAIDSSAYDVEVNDNALLQRIRDRYRNVEDLPYE